MKQELYNDIIWGNNKKNDVVIDSLKSIQQTQESNSMQPAF